MRIVLKLGTSTLTHPTGNLNIRRVEELCKVCSDLKMQDMSWCWYRPEPSPWVSASCRWPSGRRIFPASRRLRPSASAS